MSNRFERKMISDFSQRVAKTSEADIAWFSGWLCADGSVKPGRNGWAPAIRFVICDEDPLRRFSELFGNRVYGPFAESEGSLGTRPRYEWKLAGAKAVLLLERCQPWLSDRYRARADLAIKYAVKDNGGRKISPADAEAIKKALTIGGHGTGRRLAKEYGLSDGMISAIKHGRAWVGMGPAM